MTSTPTPGRTTLLGVPVHASIKDLYGIAAFGWPMLLVVGVAGVIVVGLSKRKPARNGLMDLAEVRRTDRRIEKFWQEPVTRREFELELERIWEHVDPVGTARGMTVRPEYTLVSAPSIGRAADILYSRTERICPSCGGTDFSGKTPAALYCSKKCKRAADIKALKEKKLGIFVPAFDEKRECPSCGGQFVTSSSSQKIYCSPECKRKAEYAKRGKTYVRR